jgi:hypothetical protein
MGTRVTRESDLRSLDRKSMYSIFAPLDPDERLPRELLLEARRAGAVGRRELAGILCLPVLGVTFFLSYGANLNTLAVIAMFGVALTGLLAFALSGGRRR